MKAVYIDQHGGPEALTHGERPEPEVAPGEVMLRVGGSALNHLDLGLRAGTSYRGDLPPASGLMFTTSPAISQPKIRGRSPR